MKESIKESIKADFRVVLKGRNTSNGVFIEDEEGKGSVYKFEVDGGALTGGEDLVGFLYEVLDVMGVLPSRYSKERISISVVHGDKYECKELKGKCGICGGTEFTA